jgi:hypothetical protein
MPGRYGLKVKTWIIGAILSMRLDHVFVERNHQCHGGIATGSGAEPLDSFNIYELA